MERKEIRMGRKAKKVKAMRKGKERMSFLMMMIARTVLQASTRTKSTSLSSSS